MKRKVKWSQTGNTAVLYNKEVITFLQQTLNSKKKMVLLSPLLCESLFYVATL